MKFLKNKVVQILSVIMLIAIIGVITYSLSDIKVKADDTVTMKYVNDKFGELQTQIDTLKTEIAEQQKEIENLKTENTNLKVKIEKTNYDTDIKDINNKIKKINAREDYLYNKGSIPSTSYLPSISKYINENLK